MLYYSHADMPAELIIRNKGFREYVACYRAMRRFSEARGEASADEIWCLQHPPVYTLGLNGQRRHVLSAGGVPLVKTDRGGQATYHGPGQLVVYVLFDLKRGNVGVREFVGKLEQAVIDMLAGYGIEAARRRGAPGVYVRRRKIAALGIRVKQGRSYHGIAVNVDMDLRPYEGIDVCGYRDLEVTQTKDLGLERSPEQINAALLPCLLRELDHAGGRIAYVDETQSEWAA